MSSRFKSTASRVVPQLVATATCLGMLGLNSHALAQDVHGDFNNDGFTDLAVGVPQERIGGRSLAGAVNILYGSSSGPTNGGSQLWHQGSEGVRGAVEIGDRFGSALAAGDLDGDGFDDLAIGVPAEDVVALGNAGAVNVLYGSAAGLTSAGNQMWHQDRPSVRSSARANELFGTSLSIADYDMDGFDDLAIGAPNEADSGISRAGAVHVLYGSANGLTAVADDLWRQSDLGLANTSGPLDQFGSALTSTDIDSDGYQDLVVGVPGETVSTEASAGAINVLFGSSTGLTAAGAEYWHQNTPGVRGLAESNDTFGSALAAGDFDNNGFSDVAIGVRRESVGTASGAGAVNVLYGSSDGLTHIADDIWTQDSPNVNETSEVDDNFGKTLRAGDFDGDGFADLAIGVPREDLNGIPDVGGINVLYGSPAGLSAANNDFWSQASSGIADSIDDSDGFGEALGVGDFDGDGTDDLAIGVPAEHIGNVNDAGAVNILFGTAGGLSSAGDQFWHQNRPIANNPSEAQDRFGGAL